MSTTELKPILMIGLKSIPKAITNPEQDQVIKWKTENLKQAAEEQTKKLKDIGFAPRMFFLDPENEEALEEYAQVLKEKQWLGISIGFGIRGTTELTPKFERLVNLALQEIHPSPKFMFAVQPGEMIDAVKRTFDV